MLDIIKIQDVIKGLLIVAYPEFRVYTNKMPEKFERPSFLIQYVTNTSETVNKDIIFEKVHYKVTYFNDLNSEQSLDGRDLQMVLVNMMKPFRKEYIKVEDRAVTVKASSGKKNEDEIYMDIHLEYYEDRLEEEPIYPMIEDVSIKLKEDY